MLGSFQHRERERGGEEEEEEVDGPNVRQRLDELRPIPDVDGGVDCHDDGHRDDPGAAKKEVLAAKERRRKRPDEKRALR